MDGAKIYAQNAIRKKNESLNYLRLGSRLDAVVSRLDQQAKMQVINKSMGELAGHCMLCLVGRRKGSPRPRCVRLCMNGLA